MKEFVLVEFMCTAAEALEMAHEVRMLQDEFQLERTDISEEQDQDDSYGTTYWHTWGKINSETATMIRLQNSWLAERMRISYIPDELKDKYRTKK